MTGRRKQNLKLALQTRVEARKRRDGSFTYRYKHEDGTHTALGRDAPGIPGSGVATTNRKAIDIRHGQPLTGTAAALISEFFKADQFRDLAPRTQTDYQNYAKTINRVFGGMDPRSIKPSHIARYLRIERAQAKLIANKEIAFLSSVFQFGVEIGRAHV